MGRAGVQISDNASVDQQAFLKMNTFPDRNTMIDESNSEVSAMEFSWNTQRNFLSHKKNLTPLPSTQVGSEIVHMPETSENTLHVDELETKAPKARKQQASAKSANRVASKALRPKESKKQPSVPRKKKDKPPSVGKREKKNQDEVVDGAMVDLSTIPVPVCSCTGVPRQCYRWGAGGWQSSCCTTNISEYPLPMSSSRPGARLAGRKMSIGAYGKLLQKLAAEGHDLSFAVDLKNHWARHGTNKFVTIR
ncbi:hypothetical protein J5N97_018830 [Dioscorea zingiberensis]|uniref:GAGA-binding transcriptional activator n=1 Tax=Dioscorea zingiberensis TaxID=325984 RepID=A0A9D5CD07_9LILI|nr:hypothetical protein J5N97_018830 [Dioscorea zingiberensis]